MLNGFSSSAEGASSTETSHIMASRRRRSSGAGSSRQSLPPSTPQSQKTIDNRSDAAPCLKAYVLKALPSAVLGGSKTDAPGGAAVALCPDDFRRLEIGANEEVVLTWMPPQNKQQQQQQQQQHSGTLLHFIARAKPVQSPALRPGHLGAASQWLEANSLPEGTRATVAPLAESAHVQVITATALRLVLPLAPPSRGAGEGAEYLKRLPAARRALLERAAAFSAEGWCFSCGRSLGAAGVSGGGGSGSSGSGGSGGGTIRVWFEGVAHDFVVAALEPADAAESDAEVDPLQQALSALQISGAPPLSPPPAAPPPLPLPPPPPSARKRLHAFYARHNPDKADEADGILARYAGREEVLFAKLEQKYGAGACAAADADAAAAAAAVAAAAAGTQPAAAAGAAVAAEEGGAAAAAAAAAQIGAAAGATAGAKPAGGRVRFWRITAGTRVTVSTSAEAESTGLEAADTSDDGAAAAAAAAPPDAWADGIGGLAAQVAQLREAVELPLRAPRTFERYGVRPPRGVLLHGPPGTGKTTLARAAAAACGAHVIAINGPEIMSSYVGESEAALRHAFARAAAAAPCLLVLDEIDALCPRREAAGGAAERRVAATLLALLDGAAAAAAGVAVIGCTNRPQALDPALRRPGRLDREVEVGVPDQAGREEILHVLLRRAPHALAPAHVARIAAATHGFVGADLHLLVKEAVLAALRRWRAASAAAAAAAASAAPAAAASGAAATGSTAAADGGSGGVDSTGTGGGCGGGSGGGCAAAADVRVEWADAEAALSRVAPSGLREVAVEVPRVRWDDIGGQDEVKRTLREVVELPLRHPQAFARLGIAPPRGVLLYGPPGCSKTLMARALATESAMNFVAVKGPELLSKWLGESERALQALFKRARAAAPTIVFFDEVDALAGRRSGGGGGGGTERVLSQLLLELDGVQPLKRVVVVAATNRPDTIDPALLRPGRLDRLVYVGPPDAPSRAAILRVALRGVPADVDAAALADVAQRTEGFSGAEVVALCREAAMSAVADAIEGRVAAADARVTARHLSAALAHVRPQITPEVLAFYAKFRGGGGT